VSAVIESSGRVALRQTPLLSGAERDRVVAWRNGEPVRAKSFLADVQRVAALLPEYGHAINLCDDRYAFIVSFCAVASVSHTTLLPPSRAPQAVDDALRAHPDAYVLSETPLDPLPPHLIQLPELNGDAGDNDVSMPQILGEQTVAIGFTSGSTGQPKPNTKSWDNFRLGTALNIQALFKALRFNANSHVNVVATVPAQHMYGMEMSVLLPLFGNFAVHAGKPFFPADVAAALAEVPRPRMLVTTPVHLRVLLREGTAVPPIDCIVSATAPLPAELATEAEAHFSAPLIEVFGSTETCVIASRRTSIEADWNLHDDVELRPQPDGTLVTAAHLDTPVQLQDLVELLPDQRFRLRGRNSDLLEIAGKRASLADLTRRLLSLDGVLDGVVLQLDAEEGRSVQRIAALVVAPERTEADLLSELRQAIDPVFLPRPLRRVEKLPRNETGKLPRGELLKVLTAP
jgi:acyl-coenzyme A synthetase/AMP-(fatty) acid ligase